MFLINLDLFTISPTCIILSIFAFIFSDWWPINIYRSDWKSFLIASLKSLF